MSEARRPGLSVRGKLALSYAGFLIVASVVVLTAAWVFLDRVTHVGIVFTFESGYGASVLRDFAPIAALTLAVLLAVGLGGGWLLAGRMLAPLDRITDATRVAAAGSLAHRVDLPGRQDEFRELADAFDAMLARIEAHVAEQERIADEQQRFAANASHELRTPLAITQTLLDVARAEGRGDGKTSGREDAETPADDARAGQARRDELIERLHLVNARAIDLTEALLLLSRSGQRTVVRDEVDLSLLAEEAVETLLPPAEERGIAIQLTGDAAPTTGSPALLLQLVTNLIHNAITHNLPGGGTVDIATTRAGDRARLTVENTGPELTPQLVATLTEPFQRGSTRTRSGHAGVGLGLAIAQSIADAHDAELRLEPRAGGGLRVTLELAGAAQVSRRPA